ncbi:MAG: EAL domain-containing protein [Thermoanaerobaculia bacterium]
MPSNPSEPQSSKDLPKSLTSEILLGQNLVLKLIAGGTHLSGVLEEFCRNLESALPDIRCCVMLLDQHQQILKIGAAPSLPPAFRNLLDGISVGLAPGSCSAAAQRNEVVLSENIADDPLWEGLHSAAQEHGVQACWSAPIRSVQWADKPDEEDKLRVLGTVAFYHDSPRRPTTEELELLDLASSLAALSLITARTHRKVDEQHLYDPLTGLPNRKLFAQQLEQAVAELTPREHKIGVLLLDFDHLKEVNETFGYAVGDFLLRSVAKRLTGARTGDDLLARFGDDEFVFMIRDASGGTDFRQIAGSILQAVSEPYDFSGQQLSVTASLGASLYPWDGEDAQTLMRNAENALRSAKALGRNRYRLYAPTMGAFAFEKLQLKMALSYAVENQELELFYQPKVVSQSREIIGVEALARWNHPSQGRISPGRFIPLAEETGLILPIGAWVLQKACEQVKAWRAAGHPQLTISVNISAHQFREKNFSETVASVLERAGLQPEALELEITETVAMTEVEKTMERLRELEGLGLRISIDDFGTGYSSLSYLQRFPIHALKIDQSFVMKLPAHKEDKAIVKSILALANHLDLDVVAEGVETAEQAEFLTQEGCQFLQGFYFARPMPSDECGQLLEQGLGDRRPQQETAKG